MGLRHRTPMSALREQRRCADRNAQTVLPAAFPRKGPQTHRRASLESSDQLDATFNESGLIPEKCQILLTRLRQAIVPQTDAQKRASNTEYRALQDELQRLSQHTAQHRPVNEENEVPRELFIPRSFYAHQDELPFRSIKILAPAVKLGPPLPRLERSISDLSFYQKHAHSASISSDFPTVLALVPAPHLLATVETAEDSAALEPVISAEAAKLMQQMLKVAKTRGEAAHIPQEIVLSLLDT